MAQDAAHCAAAAEAFIDGPLDEEVVVIVVEVEGRVAGHGHLGGHAIGKGDLVLIDGHIVAEGAIEHRFQVLQVLRIRLLYL